MRLHGQTDATDEADETDWAASRFLYYICSRKIILKLKGYIMKKLLAAAALAATFALTGCATYSSTAPVMSMRGNSINTYVKADIDYNSAKRVEASIDTKTLFGFIELKRNGNKTLTASNRYRGLSKREKQALYKAKAESGVDVILEPEFEKETHCWLFGAFRTSKTKVKGWGVNFKGISEDKLVNPRY